MNHLATSKEDILAASRELIKENGWAAVSIRAVASRCSVSTGTIYNYYESKADLLGDTIESIWREIFFHPEDESVFKDVTACISWIYKRLEYGNEQFPGFFSLHSFGFMKNEKADGKKKMLQKRRIRSGSERPRDVRFSIVPSALTAMDFLLPIWQMTHSSALKS